MGAVTSEATIRISYDGEALEAGTMDVRDLAPALLALSDLFDEADKVLNGPNPDRVIQLRIRHDIKKGSFDIGIEVVEAWISKIVNLFAGQSAAGVANLVGILGFSATVTVGLFKLIKWARARPVKRVELLNDGEARIVIEGDEMVVSRPVAKVFNDMGVRRLFAALLAPLQRDGIESFEVKDPSGKVIEKVTKEEAPAFAPPTPSEIPEQIVKNNFTQAYTLVSVTFKDGNKWRVFDGQSTVNVTLEDAAFLARVNRHEVQFAKDDVIRCDVRQEQTISGDGLRTEFFITRVLEHKHTYRQVVLPFETPPALPPASKLPEGAADGSNGGQAPSDGAGNGQKPAPKKRGGKRKR